MATGHDRRLAAGPAGRRDPAGGRSRTPGQRRARRSLDQPRDEAGPPVPHVAARHRDGPGGRTRRGSGAFAGRDADRAGRRSRHPGSSTCDWRDRALERRHRRDPGRPGWMGPASAGRAPAEGQRRVRVGQPDRPAARRQRPRRLRRRPALSSPRSRRPAGHARVLLQRLGRTDRQPRRIGRGHPAR